MNYLQRLQSAYPRGEARALYQWVMEVRFGLSQTQLLMGKDTELSADERNELEEIIERLVRHEPVQYILGQTDFCGHTFHVAPGVLIPRPETQELVERILNDHPTPARMLDIGTGSGCIAISLALAGHHVTAYDISPDALDIAQGNASRLGTTVDFLQVDILLQDSLNAPAQYDCIVSNPPYICQHEASEMEENVLAHEPHLALFVPDEDPLLFYRAITHYAQKALVPGGSLYFECNRAFVRDVTEFLKANGFTDVQVVDDQYGNERFAIGIKRR